MEPVGARFAATGRAARNAVARLSPTRVLALLGGVLASLYAGGMTARYPLLAGLQTPGASWSVLAGATPRAALLLGAIYGLATLGYALALRLALRPVTPQRHSLAVIVAVWLLCSAVLLGAYPGDSTDVFDYLFRGRMLAELGVSPLAVVPSQVAEQPFYAYVHWINVVDTYGPLWEYLSWGTAELASTLRRTPDSTTLAVTITAYRLLSIALAGGCGAVIAAIVRRHEPALVPAALLLWLWNPLLLTATAIGAHNDLPLLLATLLALLLLQRERWALGLVALAVAAHVKLTALLLLPLLLLHILRRGGWRRTGARAGLALAAVVPLSWLLYAPLGGWATLPRMLAERTRLLANSLAYVVYWALDHGGGWAEPDAARLTTRAATATFCGVAAMLLWRFWRAPDRPTADDARLWRYAVLITLVYLVVGAFWFQHWYVLWMIAPAALLPAHPLVWRAVPLCSLAALWVHLALDFTLTPAATTKQYVVGVGVLLVALLVGGGLGLRWCWRANTAAHGRGR